MIIRKLILILSLLLAAPAASIVAEPNKTKPEQDQITLLQGYLLPVSLAALAIYLTSEVLSDIPVDADLALAITSSAIPLI